MKAILTCLVFVLIGLACLWHRSSAGFELGLLMFGFAWVSWLARPRKDVDREL